MEKFDEKNVQEPTEQSKANVIGTKMGEIMALALCACATAVVIALTTKFIFWLF